MAGDKIQYLKHGKALCGKAFRHFVETFNWHNDFCSNIMGDGDSPGSTGCISLDRSDPKHPVIRFKNKNIGNEQEDIKEENSTPWTFSCTEDPDTGERVGGWRNKVIQVGYDVMNLDSFENGTGGEDMSAIDKTGHVDGVYYLEIHLTGVTPGKSDVQIKVSTTNNFHHDIANNILRIFIGSVFNGKHSTKILMAPVIYTYISEP